MPIDQTKPDASLEVGIVMAGDPDPAVAQAKAREEADVKRWMRRLKQTSKYDKPAREQYVRDRRYARGDTGAEVAANLVGTYIDILEAFLYARDPDFDIRPGPTVRPPSADTIRDVVEDSVQDSPEVAQLAQEMAMAAINRSRCPGSSISSLKISWLMARALFTASVICPACCIFATS